jgi:acyl CoA:acetate/3-ketoacid CoA transferase alpha subunit/acyl CoA:acetate/3-ketoacid CoA transferase beta subunit
LIPRVPGRKSWPLTWTDYLSGVHDNSGSDVDKVCSLAAAVERHVHAGDVLHPVVGHTRWSAATREVVRQWWGRDPQFTVVMLSLSSLGALFFRGKLVRKVITGYSGDTFPNFTPNPVFAGAYERGEVDIEHWSFLAFAQRLEAGARGLPAIVTRSIAGSSMEANDGFARVESPFGEVGLLSPLAPDVAILHAPVADRAGNVALQPPLLEGVWGALGARRGAIVTVERIVDDIRPWSHLVRIPAHRVLAVVECPLGAHPGGCYPGSLPADGYGEDYEFWVDARAATRSDDYDEWITRWVLDVTSQDQWIAQLGDDRVRALRAKAAPDSWRADEARYQPDLDVPVNAWEHAAVWGARYLAERVVATKADAVLAGAGVANLSAWLGVQLARERGSHVQLTAEIGLWGYDATPADPFVLNHRNFPTATMLSDANTVLGALVGGVGTTTIGCLGGAQVDRFGNVNSTRIEPRPFLVGSGGGNDVASTATENVVVATLTPQRTPADCSYVTSPGRAVRALVTDLGVLEKPGDLATSELVLTAVPPGAGSVADRVATAQAACGWDLEAAASVSELTAPTAAEVETLRRWDPRGWFLRAR